MLKKKIFIITGEASGDLLAYKVIKNLDLKKYDVRGIIGENLKKLKIKKFFYNSRIAFFGIKDVLLNIFFIKKKINDTVKYIEQYNPDIVFSVDSPDFVFRVIKQIKINKKTKPKFLHYVAPSVWAWRENRMFNIKKYFNKVYLLFDFEKKYFKKFKVKHLFVGHPFFEHFKFKKINISSKSNNLITFCPGSRKSELDYFLPIFKKVMFKLGPGYTFHIGTTKDNYIFLKNYFKNIKLKIIINFDSDQKEKLYQKSLMCVAKSGTISLDLCKSQSGIITVYKFNFLNYFLIKPFVKVKFINIINIMANKEVIPELIQSECTSEKILEKILFYIKNKNHITKMISNYNKILKRISNKSTSKVISKDIECCL